MSRLTNRLKDPVAIMEYWLMTATSHLIRRVALETQLGASKNNPNPKPASDA